MSSKFENSDTTDLINALLKIETVEEWYAFFEDICTIGEIQSLSLRWKVAKLLEDGKTYTEIMDKVDVSTATISRVSRFLNYGAGGYRSVLDKIKAEDEKNKKSGDADA